MSDPAGNQPEVITLRNERIFQVVRKIFTRQLKKQFYAVRLLAPPPSDLNPKKVCYMNHPSWSDPMVCAFLHHQFFEGTETYAPIDEEALEGYRFFRRIGLFGVGHGNAAVMRRFLRTTKAILALPQPLVVWITAQGEFTDVRARPTKLQPGLGAMLSQNSTDDISVIPVAVEMTYGEERLPEIFVHFGECLERPKGGTAKQWTQACETALEELQDQLAEKVIARDTESFETLLGGKVGVGGVYGFWKRFCAAIQGKKYDPSHASLTKPEG